MSTFRSLHLRYSQEEALHASGNRPWPATYRDHIPVFNPNEMILQIRIENQLPQSLSRKQLSMMPSFTESRRITSKAGWTYYGQWKGITFQTLFNLFATPHLYPWVRLESMNGQHYSMDKNQLLNHRLLMECDGEPLSPLYGGPFWIHCFDHYIEYSIPYVKSVILMQEQQTPYHPATEIGFRPEEARVEPGKYFAIHHQKIAML